MVETSQPITVSSGKFVILLFATAVLLNSKTGVSQTPPENSEPQRVAALPTETTLDDLMPSPVIEDMSRAANEVKQPSTVFAPPRRFRPYVDATAEWLPANGPVGIASYGAQIKVPTYPVFGPPPPMIQLGYIWTEFQSTDEFELPNNVMDVVVGSSWVRRLNDRWTLRVMGNVAFASDGDNTSSDAWQFRGGAFALYSRDPEWIWTLGVIALGRNDLPAVPAVGLIWQPRDTLKIDLILPRPRVNVLLLDGGERQCWGYFGGGFSGGTWAFEDTNGRQDQLTYGDWRVVLGWESVPRVEPGVPFQRGRKLGCEVGYSFAREIEFERDSATISLDDTLLLQAKLSF